MVVFHHARGIFPPDSILYTSFWSEVGSRGVDIFFVISGFVMAHSTLGYDPRGDRVQQAGAFMIKRVIRVVPLYWIATLWTAKHLILSGGANLDLVRDFLFLPRFHDQQHDLVWPYLFQGWTINYEMFFYALFALSMLVGRWRIAALSTSLLVMISLGVFASIVHAHSNSAAIIFYTSNMLVEFLMGVWLFYWMRGHAHRPPTAVLVATLLIAFCLLAIPNPDMVRGFADGCVSVLIVWSGVLLSRGTDWRWLRKLGDVSYSTYLFHMTIFGIVRWIAGALGLVSHSIPSIVAGIVLYMVLASLLGLVIHQWVERPMLAFMRGWLDKPRPMRVSSEEPLTRP